MGVERYPDGQPPPLQDRWPGAARAGEGPLHLDLDGLTRALQPLVRQIDDLAGAGKGGLSDLQARLNGTEPWGRWLTAERQHAFHGQVAEQYLAAFGQVLSQLGETVQVAMRNGRNMAGSDQDAATALAHIGASAEQATSASSAGPPVAPVSSDGGFD